MGKPGRPVGDCGHGRQARGAGGGEGPRPERWVWKGARRTPAGPTWLWWESSGDLVRPAEVGAGLSLGRPTSVGTRVAAVLQGERCPFQGSCPGQRWALWTLARPSHAQGERHLCVDDGLQPQLCQFVVLTLLSMFPHPQNGPNTCLLGV